MRRRGFTFIEAITAVTIASIAGVAPLTGVNTAHTKHHVRRRTNHRHGHGEAVDGRNRRPKLCPRADESIRLAAFAELSGISRSGPVAVHQLGGLQQSQPNCRRSIRGEFRWATTTVKGARGIPAMQTAAYFANWQRTAIGVLRQPNKSFHAAHGGTNQQLSGRRGAISIQDKAGVCIQWPACDGCLHMYQARKPIPLLAITGCHAHGFAWACRPLAIRMPSGLANRTAVPRNGT